MPLFFFLQQNSSTRCIIISNYVWKITIHWLCLSTDTSPHVNKSKRPRSIRDQNTHTWVCRTKSANCWSLAHNSIILRRSWISCGKRSDRGRRVYATRGHKWPGARLKKGVVPKGKNTFESGINLVPAGMKTVLSQTSVTTPHRLCHLKGYSFFQQ